MSKITKTILTFVLAFFILDAALVFASLNAQDIKTLDNGLRVILREDHRNPIVVFSVFIDVGSAHEGEYSGSGISHLIEHMLFKGTKKYPPGSIETTLHKYGGRINAFTSYDYTSFRITILKKHKDIALDILSEILNRPSFDAKELEKEMQVIEREMDMNDDDPSRKLSRLTFSTAYTRHPYKIPIIGHKENFKRLKRADLLKFFKSNYTSEKIVISIVGDIESDEIFDSAEKFFGGIPRGSGLYAALPVEPEQLAEKRIEEKLDMDGAHLNVAFHSTGLLDKDLYALDLLSFILGDGEDSILNKELRLKKELVLSIGSYNYTPKYPGLFVISSVLKEENVKGAIDEIIKQLEGVKETGITSGDLTRAKNNFIAGYIYLKETIESQADDLAIAELLTGSPEFFEQYIKEIKRVSLEDIQRVARKYLNRGGMTVTVVSKSGDGLKSDLVPIAQRRERKIKKTILPNKLTLLISEDSSLPIVSISLLFKGGLRLETEKNNGIAKLASLMLMDGIESMTREEVASFYESKGMMVSAYSANNSMGILVKCLEGHTEDALKLVSRLCMESIFPEVELEREKRELISAIEMQDNSIFNHGHRILKKSLFKTHPYGLQVIGTVESIKGINRGNIMDLYKNILSGDNMVLGIAGDCRIDEIEVLVKKYFSRIPLRESFSKAPTKESRVEAIRDILISRDKEQSLVLVGFQGIDIYDKDRYAFEVMTDMLSSESGMIFRSIREKSGLSYAAGAFHVLGLDPGYIAIYALTSKENIEVVKDIILKEIESFIKKGASPEEIQKTKNHLKAIRHMEIQTNASFMFMSAMDELYGIGYENYKDYEKNIDDVTKEDIKRAAMRYLTLGGYAIVILEGK